MALTEVEVDESLEAIVETFCRDSPNPSVVVADGDGVQVRVERGHLDISDGLGPHRRVRRYAKATHGLARLVVVGASGSVSLAAMRWCAGVGIGIVVIDPRDGSILSTSGACAVDDARLRRSQALALATDTGLTIARYLIGTKLAGQASVADSFGDGSAANTIRGLANDLAGCQSLEEIRQREAAAANVYWRTWEAVPVNFIRKDLPRVPESWKRFDGRRSAINPGTARSATDPVNALLNYSFRLVEAEARLAVLALGLDPGFGILHADMRNRDGFVLDLMEAARPIAEQYVADLLASHHFLRRDFEEDARGVVRVLAPLSHRLAEAMPSFGFALASVAEHVAQLFGNASPYDMTTPSALTNAKHKEAARRRSGSSLTTEGTRGTGPNAGGMSPRAKARQRPRVESEARLPQPICTSCGGTIPLEADRERPRGKYCPACLADRRRELGTSLAAQSARTCADQEFRTGRRPTHTPEAKQARQEGNMAQRAIQAAWEAEHAGEFHDPEWFTRKVLPALQDVSLTTIARATDMSTSSASKVRAGRRMPHPRHWEPLAELAGVAVTVDQMAGGVR
jgi:CRISPR-associated endonuclease Cas1